MDDLNLDCSDRGAYIAKKTNEIFIELMNVLQEFVLKDSGDIDVYPALMAAQMVTESVTVRLRKMNVDEDLIDLAKTNATNNIAVLIAENDGMFSIKGEEV